MKWEKKRFLVELEIKEVEIRLQGLTKWISFVQTVFLLTAGATVSILYKTNFKLNWWTTVGTIVTLSVFTDLLYSFIRIAKLESRIAEIRNRIEGEEK